MQLSFPILAKAAAGLNCIAMRCWLRSIGADVILYLAGGQFKSRVDGEFKLDSCFLSRYIQHASVNFFTKIPSRADRRFARVAQLVEQRTENPRVGGSNPSYKAAFYIAYQPVF